MPIHHGPNYVSRKHISININGVIYFYTADLDNTVGQICDCCSKKRPVWHVTPNFADRYPYVPPEGLCSDCFFKADYQHVVSIPEEELPLWVSHVWFSKDSTRAFKDRLETLLQN